MRSWCTFSAFSALIVLSSLVHAQTPSTGAVTGIALDPNGAILPGVVVYLAKENSAEENVALSDKNGHFGFLLLQPGAYKVTANKTDFKSLSLSTLHVHVTETIRLELHLQLATQVENTEVSSEAVGTQLNTSALGRVINEQAITGLPLVTRNFTQMTGLSAGVVTGVYNAGELGTGGTPLSQIGKSTDGLYVHGTRSYDTNWQLDAISVNDVQGTGSISGGIPIPNPDSLAEFKVQTGIYDASFGRAAGANVSVITESGGNTYHGTMFEFLRNDVLNANDYFLNRTGQERQPLKQNQFGFAFGGPIERDKLAFFASYQGTRQVNGLAAGESRIACTGSLSEPPLTNDRSPTVLGKLFGGMKGALGGVAVDPNGSNINPVALALLNFRLPDGSFLIPTPQTIDGLRGFVSSGFSAFTQPCTFAEDQGIANLDYDIAPKSQFAARFFMASTDQSVTFPGGSLNPIGNIRGFTSTSDTEFTVFSLAHTYVISGTALNEARIGFVRTSTATNANAPLKWSQVGVAEGDMNKNDELPSLSILGSLSMAAVTPRTYSQRSLVLSDILSMLKGAHTLKLGGSLTRLEDNLEFFGAPSSIQFLSWPDFLLGLDANGNGTGTFSNVFASSDIFGLLNRRLRAWESSAFAQDDYRIRRSVTLNLGLRYERVGQFGDELGRSSSFDFSKADANPPKTGSLDGYIVGSNFPAAVSQGVVRSDNTFGNYGQGQNTLAPRLGFAWQILPTTTRLVLRGGYGMYYSRPTGQASGNQSVIAAPFALTRISNGLANASATFQAPFAQPFPTVASFPMFQPYSSNTKTLVNVVAPNFRPAMIQQFSINSQGELYRDWLLEIGYVGTRGIHLQRFRSLNQALNANPDSPIRGITSNTLANIAQRVPIPGILPDSLRELESEGGSWYNALETSLSKRASRGLQLLASYTFGKTLDTDGADINATSQGNALTLGDQNSPQQRWGRASFDRTHRFIFSSTWTLPNPAQGVQRAVLGNWSLAGIITIQSGTALTIADTNSTNVFGISEDRAQLSGNCSVGELVTGGSVQSKLSQYFNRFCFTTPLIIGADGIGTAFGNSATGLVSGPAQANLDIAISRTMPLKWPVENSTLQFRAEFFNALNHPQFANPDTNFSSPTFGVITSTSVNPRVGQLAVKLIF